MADTGIQWTDKTWNPTTGCTRVSEGCRNCYAFQLHDMRHAAHKAGKKVAAQYAKPFKELQLFEDRLTDPLHWRKPCRVFVNSMSDLFHKDVPDEFLNGVFRTMIAAKQHTFQVLTKRPERMLKYVGDRWQCGMGGNWEPAPNIWLGVSVENQAAADERIPLLLQTPAAVRFLSCEPLLGPIKFDNNRHNLYGGIHWAIIGGESGPGARRCRLEWIRDIARDCNDAAVAVFIKQLGSNPDAELIVQGRVAGRDRFQLTDKKGGDPAEWPTDLRIREFPEVSR